MIIVNKLLIISQDSLKTCDPFKNCLLKKDNQKLLVIKSQEL